MPWFKIHTNARAGKINLQFVDREMQMEQLAETILSKVMQSVRVVHDLPGLLLM